MKKGTKILSLFMSVLMLVSTLFSMPVMSFADDSLYVKGVDVSKWNGAVDFEALKEQGYEFAMIRIGYIEKGQDVYDSSFFQNIQGAYKAGMQFGLYFFSYAFDAKETQAEIDFTLRAINLINDKYMENLTFPIAYDLESDLISKNCTKSQITANAVQYCNAIRDAGYTPMVYANGDWFKNYIDVKQIDANGIGLWYAKPESNPDFSDIKTVAESGIVSTMWQYEFGEDSDDGFDKNAFLNLNISLSTVSYTYDGKAKKPSVTVKLGGTKLVNGTDYSVTYSNNTNVGIGTAQVTLKGKYKGTISKAFTINPKKTSVSGISALYKGFKVTWNKQATQTTGYEIQYATDSGFTKNVKNVTISINTTTSKAVTGLSSKTKYYVRVRTYKTIGSQKYYSLWSGAKSITTLSYPDSVVLSKSSYEYDGKAKKPSVTVTNNGKTVSSKYYTVTYASGRKNVGTYTATVKFKSPYSGTVKKTFTIKPKSTTISSVSAKSKGFTLKWKKQATQTTGYEIQYATDSKFTKNVKSVTVGKNSTTSKTVSKLTANKKYYIRIRTYKTISGKKIYSAWSKSKTVITKK